MERRSVLLLGCLWAVLSTGASGQDSGGSQATPPSWLQSAVWVVQGQVGEFRSAPDLTLPDLEEGTAIQFSMSVFPGPPFPGYTVGFDFGAWWLQRSYQTVVEGAINNRTPIKTSAFHLGTRAGLPATWPVTVSALVGFTYVDHVMEAEMAPDWLFGSTGKHREDEGGGWAPYWGLALGVRIGPVAAVVEPRWILSNASFDEPFSMRDLPLGGSVLYLGLAWHPVPLAD